MLSSVFGQEVAIEALSRSIADDRVASAYLFAGPGGVGKRTVALALARVLLCEGPQNGAPCESCHCCRQTANSVELHPSLLLFQDVLAPLAVERGALMRLGGYEAAQEAEYLDAMAVLADLGLMQFSPSAAAGLEQLDCLERNQTAVFEKSDSKAVSLAAIDRSIELAQKHVQKGTDFGPYRLAEHLFRHTAAGLYQSTIKIWLIRNVLQQRLANRPLLGGRHICIMDDAHKMQEPAQNCLLKTLEEPPLGTVIILVTENPSALLPTILSRCQKVDFKRLQTDAIARFLIERRGIESDIASSVSSFAGGSLGRAISVNPDELLKRRAVVADLIGCITGQKLDDVFAVADGALLQGESSNAKKRQWAMDLLDMFLVYARDAIVRRQGQPAGERMLLGVDPASLSLSESCSVEQLFRLDADVRRAREKIEGNADIRLTLEALLLQWLTPVGRPVFK
ncbi:MAG: hypothetical protein JW759_09465 [Candidatus Coatesbacteria bacterium]|nr:hypothetical protein [Candidatus Coatesbacteria bacterium]